MVNWARENAAASALGNAPIRWLVDDCVKFVEREIRRGNTYDGIIMDPPSYGRGPKGEIWKLEDNIFPFIELASRLLSENALFFLVNSYTTGLQPAVLTYMIHTALTPRFGGRVESSESGFPSLPPVLSFPAALPADGLHNADYFSSTVEQQQMCRIKSIVKGLRKLPPPFPVIEKNRNKGEQAVHFPQRETEQIRRRKAVPIADQIGHPGAGKHDNSRRAKRNSERFPWV